MIYCISDIHGCYDEFMALLDKIKFDPEQDTLYILGDAIDRGPQPLDCLTYIKKTKSIHLLMGNHEQMMLDFFDCKDSVWNRNGNETTLSQFNGLRESEQDRILSYVRKRPYYKTVGIGEKRYFLSHAGLNPRLPFKEQSPYELVWSRREFYRRKALKRHICVFGHTPTANMHSGDEFGIWHDPVHQDKINIDCGCVYGGKLAALRLDDGEVFYVEREI